MTGVHSTSPKNHECTPATFSDPLVHGVKVLKILAATATDVRWIPDSEPADPFCNVTITYTHPGFDDQVNVQVWLPFGDDWNERFLGIGGVGFATGVPNGPPMIGAVKSGFAAGTTDGGHEADSPWSAQSWALKSPGNINWPLWNNFAHVAVSDMTYMAKDIIRQFYGKSPEYSYWSGCSTGGRQGLALAQRSPGNYDGILAIAPTVNWAEFLVAMLWPYIVMNQMKQYPRPCELNYIQQQAIKACDLLDGLTDGIISAPDLCTIDARTFVGHEVSCEGHSDPVSITAAAAEVANAVWTGPHHSNDSKGWWFGLSRSARLSGTMNMVNTDCNFGDMGEACIAHPFPIAAEWIKLVLKRDPKFNIDHLTIDQYSRLRHESIQQFSSIMSFNDPDIRLSASTGTKIMTWHGLDDELLPSNGTRKYYEEVLAVDPNAADYYRYYEVPGVEHCLPSGTGPYPYEALQQLRRWVEYGNEPDYIEGMTMAGGKRKICAWPKVARYLGGNENLLESWGCAGGWADDVEAEGRRDRGSEVVVEEAVIQDFVVGDGDAVEREKEEKIRDEL